MSLIRRSPVVGAEADYGHTGRASVPRCIAFHRPSRRRPSDAIGTRKRGPTGGGVLKLIGHSKRANVLPVEYYEGRATVSVEEGEQALRVPFVVGVAVS